MSHLRPKLLFAVAFALCFAPIGNGIAGAHHRLHWKVAGSETQWTARYNNCDYGYYVLLPHGVVGHETLPPAPNHGFLVALPDVGTTAYALDRKVRTIWVDASYSYRDANSLAALVREQKSTLPRPNTQTATRMAARAAVQIRSATGAGKNELVDVRTMTLRAGIIYTIELQTDGAHEEEDEAEYRRIVLGFRLLPLPPKGCSNG